VYSSSTSRYLSIERDPAAAPSSNVDANTSLDDDGGDKKVDDDVPPRRHNKEPSINSARTVVVEAGRPRILLRIGLFDGEEDIIIIGPRSLCS